MLQIGNGIVCLPASCMTGSCHFKTPDRLGAANFEWFPVRVGAASTTPPSGSATIYLWQIKIDAGYFAAVFAGAQASV